MAVEHRLSGLQVGVAGHDHIEIVFGLFDQRIFQQQAQIDPARFIQLIQSDPHCYRLDGQDKLRINRELTDVGSRLDMLEYLFHEIALRDAA